MAPHNIVDPKTKYPKPPYKKQEQPWPGLASKRSRHRTTVRRAILGRGALPGGKR